MRKSILLAFAAILLAGCSNNVWDEDSDVGGGSVTSSSESVKKFTFTVKGEFGAASFKSGTRAYLSADGKEMTDLWVFDYVDGQCKQWLHQSPDSANWGTPTMSLTYGTHHVYFVASRGKMPTLDETAHTITWGTVSDTFWKDYEVEVVSTSNGNRAVTLDRVATRLRITINDEIPAEFATMSVTPATWYYGLDFLTGEPTGGQTKAMTVSVPSSYVGTKGQLAASFYGLSSATEWNTDVSVLALDGSGTTIAEAEIDAAPMKRNRSTEYEGNLFGTDEGFSVGLIDTWDDAQTGSW